MAIRKPKAEKEATLNLVPMIDITSFILLALAILSMTSKKEASLDKVVDLPPVVYASKQDSTQLQIFILPATVRAGGSIDPDSTGLVAFMDKGKPPAACPQCGLVFRAEEGEYVAGSLLGQSGKPLATLQKEAPEGENTLGPVPGGMEKPEAYLCSRCRYEISPYVKLDEIPTLLKKKKKEVVENYVHSENISRARLQKPLMSAEEIKRLEDGMPLMIKADRKAFYGRILEVVYMSMDTACGIKKFVFVSNAESSIEVTENAAEAQEKGSEP